MTDKQPAPIASPNPRVRRISQPRLKKAPAQAAPEAAPEPAPTAAPEPAPSESGPDARTPFPSGAGSLPAASESHPPVTGEWPDPEAASSGGTASPDHKRKRRRRKGKGQSAQAHAGTTGGNLTGDASDEPDESDEPAPQPITAPRPAPAPAHTAPPRPPAPRGKIDPETLTRKAWKIFLAEVSEEGVALIGDQDARELARRCFRLAEIFIEEQSRRAPSAS